MNVDHELQRWIVVNAAADAAAGFRAGWARLARFVAPPLREWKSGWHTGVRDDASLRSWIGALLTELGPRVAWSRLQEMQQVVAERPTIAYAVRCLPLYDQLQLTLELLRERD